MHELPIEQLAAKAGLSEPELRNRVRQQRYRINKEGKISKNPLACKSSEKRRDVIRDSDPDKRYVTALGFYCKC